MNPTHTSCEHVLDNKVIVKLSQLGKAGLLHLLLLLGSLTWIPSLAIRCHGVDQGLSTCVDEKSCQHVFEINISNMTELMSPILTRQSSCKKDARMGCAQTLSGVNLRISCSCNTDLCDRSGKWDTELERILQPYRRIFLTKQQKVETPSNNQPSSPSSSPRSFSYSYTTLIFHTPKVPSSTMTTTEDPSEDLFWTHCEVIAILLVFFGLASIGFVLLTLLFTFEWSWKEKCCGKYREKVDIEANLGGVVNEVAVKRPILKARRRVKKVPAAPQNVNPVEPTKVEESPLIPV